MVWNIYMAAMTSCENTQNASLFFSHRPQRQPKIKHFCPWLFVPLLLPGRIQVSLWIIVINKSHNPLVLWVLCEWSIQHSITNRAPRRALSKVSYWEARPRRFLYVFLSPTNKAPYASLSIFFENRIYLGCFFKQNWGSKSHWSWQSKYRNKITVFQRKWRVQYKEIIQGSEMHFLYLFL